METSDSEIKEEDTACDNKLHRSKPADGFSRETDAKFEFETLGNPHREALATEGCSQDSDIKLEAETYCNHGNQHCETGSRQCWCQRELTAEDGGRQSDTGAELSVKQERDNSTYFVELADAAHRATTTSTDSHRCCCHGDGGGCHCDKSELCSCCDSHEVKSEGPSTDVEPKVESSENNSLACSPQETESLPRDSSQPDTVPSKKGTIIRTLMSKRKEVSRNTEPCSAENQQPMGPASIVPPSDREIRLYYTQRRGHLVGLPQPLPAAEGVSHHERRRLRSSAKKVPPRNIAETPLTKKERGGHQSAPETSSWQAGGAKPLLIPLLPKPAHRSGGQATGLSLSGGQATGLSQSGGQATGLSQSGGQATGLSQSGGQATGLSQSGGQATGLSQSGGQATGLSIPLLFLPSHLAPGGQTAVVHARMTVRLKRMPSDQPDQKHRELSLKSRVQSLNALRKHVHMAKRRQRLVKSKEAKSRDTDTERASLINVSQPTPPASTVLMLQGGATLSGSPNNASQHTQAISTVLTLQGTTTLSTLYNTLSNPTHTHSAVSNLGLKAAVSQAPNLRSIQPKMITVTTLQGAATISSSPNTSLNPTHSTVGNQGTGVAVGQAPKFRSIQSKMITQNSPNTDNPSLESRPVRRGGQSSYRCKLCPKTCPNQKGLAQHMVIHDRQEPVSCNLCSATFPNHHLMRTHLSLVHSYRRRRKSHSRSGYTRSGDHHPGDDSSADSIELDSSDEETDAGDLASDDESCSQVISDPEGSTLTETAKKTGSALPDTARKTYSAENLYVCCMCDAAFHTLGDVQRHCLEFRHNMGARCGRCSTLYAAKHVARLEVHLQLYCQQKGAPRDGGRASTCVAGSLDTVGQQIVGPREGVSLGDSATSGDGTSRSLVSVDRPSVPACYSSNVTDPLMQPTGTLTLSLPEGNVTASVAPKTASGPIQQFGSLRPEPGGDSFPSDVVLERQRDYKCPHCPRICPNKTGLVQHIAIHKRGGAVKCGLCSATFISDKCRKKPLKSVHRISRRYLTVNGISTRYLLGSSSTGIDTDSTEATDLVGLGQGGDTADGPTHSDVRETTGKDSDLHMTSSDLDLAPVSGKEIVKNSNSDGIPFSTDTGSGTSRENAETFGGSIRHQMKSTGRVRFCCDQCPLKFLREYRYHLHMVSHLRHEEIERYIFVCPFCKEARFKTERAVDYHVDNRWCGVVKAILKMTKQMPRVPENIEVMCAACRGVYSSLRACSEHAKGTGCSKRAFRCASCTKSFFYNSSLLAHRRLCHPDTATGTASATAASQSIAGDEDEAEGSGMGSKH
ncbi:uncharacterized protein [Littorina saxatilis]|uniref:C2H2-type domain-containing protein n=1 Tax=Littorina saxatilis TaxID=31220 RepID=A0AAN9ASE7_9CAEN